MSDPRHHEPDAIAARTLRRLGALMIVILLTVAGSTFVGWRFLFPGHRHGATQEQPVPPPPRLQPDPAAQYRAERGQDRARLKAWGWVDRERGIARVPVERALEQRLRDAGEAE
ncbi:hypothetical protein [Coralloluteibacterium stylophorae]|uniref:Uncharacterized protein n=1 Tax=Coralloluteibacterium stylophorae TaxID=1776034 RepID=A0A8J8AYL0_9GAMM|nr:hypothetical protein [Coralloluteibacterium stylophorae]MBS7456394.1 hypothetical protein [Coralloluteibacterium stylophorae]